MIKIFKESGSLYGIIKKDDFVAAKVRPANRGCTFYEIEVYLNRRNNPLCFSYTFEDSAESELEKIYNQVKDDSSFGYVKE